MKKKTSCDSSIEDLRALLDGLRETLAAAASAGNTRSVIWASRQYRRALGILRQHEDLAKTSGPVN